MYRVIFSSLLLFVNFKRISPSNVFFVLPVLMFIYILFDEIIVKRKRIDLLRDSLKFFSLLVALIIVAILYTAKTDLTFTFVIFRALTFFLFFITFLLCAEGEWKRVGGYVTFVRLAYIPLLVFVTLNLLLFFWGLKAIDYDIGDSLILSNFGINIKRAEFFLTVGINAYGAVLGILLNLSLIGWGVIKGKHRSLFIFGIIVSIISLLLTDSRGPIIYSLLTFFVVGFVYRRSKKPRFLWIIPFIGFIGPILMLAILNLIAQSGYGEAVSRSSEDLATGNARSIIWAIAINEFASFKIAHIFGYGEYGQYTAGLSQKWGIIFGDKEGAEFMHPHNTFLSIALDYGYFGLIVFITVQYQIIKAISENWNREFALSRFLLANLLYFNLVGIGETMFGFYYQNVNYLFFMINSFAFLLLQKYQKPFQKLKYVRHQKTQSATNTSSH